MGGTAAAAVAATVPASMARRENEPSGSECVAPDRSLRRCFDNIPIVLPTIGVQLTAARLNRAYCGAFSSMNVKSDWFKRNSPDFGVDAPVWKPAAFPWQAIQLDDASGTSPWLYVSSVEFARNVGAGEQVMSGCLTKSVWGVGAPALCECSDVQANALGHCVLSNI